MRSAHDLFGRAVQLAAQSDLDETAAQWAAADAETHALVGQCAEARTEAAEAIARSRDDFTLERSGRALAPCGAATEASKVAGELALPKFFSPGRGRNAQRRLNVGSKTRGTAPAFDNPTWVE